MPPAAQGGMTMDYIAFDPATRFVWVPAGNTGAVDVVDTSTGKVRQISSLPTKDVDGGPQYIAR